MKAYVGSLSSFSEASPGYVQISVSYIQTGQDPVVSPVNVFLNGINTLADLQAAALTEIMAFVSSQGFSMTANDIIWAAPNLLEPFQSIAVGGIQSGSINGKTVANTTIFTNTSGMNFLVTDVYVIPVSLSGTGTPPIVNVGKTGSAYNDIVNGLSLSVLTALNTFSRGATINGASILANNEAIVVRVATAALLYTTYNFKVVVQGIYI